MGHLSHNRQVLSTDASTHWLSELISSLVGKIKRQGTADIGTIFTQSFFLSGRFLPSLSGWLLFSVYNKSPDRRKSRTEEFSVHHLRRESVVV